MASPVPYEGAPELATHDIPTPSVNVTPYPAAFGENVAGAISTLGKVSEQAGSELTNRAFAMQELQLHADANAKLADSQNQMLQRTLQFGQLEGKAAVDGYPQYLQDLEIIRKNGGQGLPPYGQFLYDSESRNSRFRLSYFGGEHAATEQKKYIVGSSKAKVASLENEAGLDPDNPTANASRLASIQTEIEHQNEVAGLSKNDPQWNLNVAEGKSAFIGAQIRGLAEKDPFKAQKLLDQSVASKDLQPGTLDAYGRNSIQRLQDLVDNKLNTIGSRVVGSETMSGKGFHFSEGMLNDTQILNGLKASESGTYSFRGPTVTDKAGNSGQALGHYGVMSYNLAKWLREAGMPAMSEQQFLADPSAQDKLVTFKFNQYQQEFGSGTAAAIAWFGGEGAAAAYQQYGPSYLSKLHDVNMDGNRYLTNFNRGLASTASLKDVRAVGAKVAEEHAPGNTVFADTVDKHLESLWGDNERQMKDDEFNNAQTLDNALMAAGPNGKIPTTVDELTADPSVKAAWDALLPSDRLKVMDRLTKNAKGDVPMTQARLLEYGQLKGLATSDPAAFLKSDVLGADLPISAKKELLNLKARVYKNQEADPNVARALRIPKVAGMLSDLGLTTQGDKDGLNQFSTYLGDEISAFAAENGRQPKEIETIEIATNLLQSQATGQWSLRHPLGGGQKPFFEFQQKAPYDWAVRVKELTRGTLGYDPSDEEVDRWYNQQQYNEKYGKPKARGSGAGAPPE